MTKNVQNTELHMAAFLAEHDLSFNLMDHMSDLLPILCPDSRIAGQFKCKRTKMTCIIKNALAPHFHKMLVEKLKDSFFSIIIDETTDVSTCKQLAIITRVYNNETKTVQCKSLSWLMEMLKHYLEPLAMPLRRNRFIYLIL